MIKKVKKWFRKHWKDIMIDSLIGVFVLGMIAVGGLFIWISTLEIPDLSAFEQRRILTRIMVPTCGPFLLRGP